MKFEEALAAMREGKKVNRQFLAWDETCYGEYHGDVCEFDITSDGFALRGLASIDGTDILAIDWQIVAER